MVTPTSGSELNDDALAEDIDLLADLVVPATGMESPLTQEEVDDVLGVIHMAGSPQSQWSPRTHVVSKDGCAAVRNLGAPLVGHRGKSRRGLHQHE